MIIKPKLHLLSLGLITTISGIIPFFFPLLNILPSCAWFTLKRFKTTPTVISNRITILKVSTSISNYITNAFKLQITYQIWSNNILQESLNKVTHQFHYYKSLPSLILKRKSLNRKKKYKPQYLRMVMYLKIAINLSLQPVYKIKYRLCRKSSHWVLLWDQCYKVLL